MTHPNEHCRELLSAYLDGSLSPDELARVEQMMHDDESLVGELAQMRQQRADLQRSFASSPRLDSDFSARVLQAAYAQAEAENLPASHPLRIAQSNHGSSSEPSDRRGPDVAKGNRLTWAGAALALAACVMMMFALRPAGQTELSLSGDPVPDAVSDNDASLASNVPVSEADESMLASSHTDRKSSNDQDASKTDADVGDGARVASDSPKAAPSDLIASAAVGPHGAAIAEVAMPTDAAPRSGGDEPSPQMPPAQDDSSLAGKLAFSILLEVELTQRGAELDELGYALHAAGIEDVQPYSMNREQLEQMVASKAVSASAFDAAPRETGDTQLLLLRGPAKQLDRFMLSLFQRSEVVKRVGFQMVMQRGLVSTIDQLSKIDDASAVRHRDGAAIARRLTFGEGVDHFPHSDESAFNVLTPEMATQLNRGLAPTPESGPDFMTHLLVLVRSN